MSVAAAEEVLRMLAGERPKNFVNPESGRHCASLTSRPIPVSFPIPPANRVALGIGTAIKRDAVVVKVTHRRRPRRLGRGAPRPRPHRRRQADRDHAEAAHHRHGRARRRRRLGEDVPLPARQPRHGRRRLPRDERHRHGPVGHPRQGLGSAPLSTPGRSPQGNTGLCRRRFARLPGTRTADRGSEEVDRAGLQGDQAARRRLAEEATSNGSGPCARRSATSW